MSIVLVGSTSGSITLQEPAIAGSTTINLPATSGTALVAPTALTVPNTTGTVMVSGNMPAFSASRTGSTQAISNGVVTKIQFQTEEFDTASCYDNATNYRFTPNVAGYYQINGSVGMDGTALQLAVIRMYKNGSLYKQGNSLYDTGGVMEGNTSNVSDVVYLNGSTDYVEMYGVFLGSSAVIGFVDKQTFFSGVLVRAA